MTSPGTDSGGPALGRRVGVVLLAVATALSGTAGLAGAAAVGAGAGSAATVEAGGATLVVDADGGGNYTSIQAAVDAAADGDRIEVRSGTYHEEVVIRQNLTLVAPAGATLDGSTVTGSVGTYPTGVRIEGPAAPTVSGFTIVDYFDGVNADGSGDWVLRDVTIRNVSNRGVYAEGSTGDWTLRDVTIRGVTSGASTAGVVAREATGDWSIRESTIRRIGQYGVRARDATGNWTIADTTIENVYTGVFDANGDGWAIRNVTVTDATLAGVDAAPGDWTIRNVTVRNASDAIVPGGVGTTARGNWTVRGAYVTDVGDGVVARDARGDWRVTNATFVDVEVGVKAWNASGDWRVEHAAIVDARAFGVSADDAGGSWAVRHSALGEARFGTITANGSTHTGDAGRNWWGTPDGPDADDCRGNVDCSTPLSTPPDGGDATSAPTARTGADRPVIENATATLDASASTDADGVVRGYAWRQVGGPAVTLDDPHAAAPTFTAPTVNARTTLSFVVTVVDGRGGADAARVNVTVTPERDTLVVDADGGGDYTSIQAAVDAAADGDRVEVRPGTFREEVQVDANVTLVAPEGATLDGSGLGQYATGIQFVASTGPVAATVSGFTVEDYSLYGVQAAEGDWTLRDLTVRSVGDDAVYARSVAGDWTVAEVRVGGADDAVNARETTGDWTVRGVNATGGGIAAVGSEGDWTALNLTAPGVFADDSAGDWRVSGYRSRNAYHAVSATDTTGSWTVRGSDLSDSDGAAVDATGADPAGNATGNWWGAVPVPADECVGNVTCADPLQSPEDDPGEGSGHAGDGSGDGTLVVGESDNYTSIQAAVDAAADGDRIEVRPGTYREQVTLATNVTLAAPEGATLDGSTLDATYGVEIDGPAEPTVEGFTIVGFTDGVDARGTTGAWTLLNLTVHLPGTAVDASNTAGAWAVHGSDLTDTGGNAIYAYGADPAGDATGNWWGGGNGGQQCYGNVTCAEGLAAPPGAGRTGTVVVGPDGQYDSIDTAVDSVTNGTTVEVQPGVYRERVSIERDVTLVAPEGATLAGSTLVPMTALTIEGGAAPTVENLRLLDHGVGLRVDSARNWTVRNLTVRDATTGASLSGRGTLRDARIHDVTTGVRNGYPGGNWTVDGLRVSDAGDGVLADQTGGDWTVRDAVLRNLTNMGVAAERTTGDWTLRNVTVRDATGSGVEARLSSGDWVARNVSVRDVGEDGVTADENTGTWTVDGLDVRNVSSGDLNRGTGLDAHDTTADWRVTDLTVRNVSRAGLAAATATGDWTARNVTVVDAGDGVTAGEGNWTLRDLTVAGVEDNGVETTGGAGDWTIRDARLADGGQVGVVADEEDGAWTIRNATVTDYSTVGVDASGADGNWTVRRSVVANVTGTAVHASGTAGDWTLRNVTVRSAGVGVEARGSTGDWSIRDALLADLGTAGGGPFQSALVVSGTGGRWTIHGSSLVEVDGTVVEASDADPRGNATGNWWGRPSVPADACVGNVTCADPLASAPVEAGAGAADPSAPGDLTGDGRPATDPDDDGAYEDVDGDGAADFDDAVETAFLTAHDLSVERTRALDFDADGDFDVDDAVELAFEVA